MGKGTDPARKLRKMRDSREGWKSRAGEKQQEIKRLRGAVRDLMVSREHWKSRVEELEQRIYALQQEALSGPCTFLFFGG
jgi:polyhydroxyalkanoate synthesis regulator phasin